MLTDNWLRASRNGIKLRLGKPTLAVVSGTVLSRGVTEIFLGSSSKTYSLPDTIITIHQNAFNTINSKPSPVSVRLNEGLEVLESDCFSYSDIRHLVLPASVRSIGPKAFYKCLCLESMDLRAARNLKELTKDTFGQCKKLRQVLLNEGLETIGLRCFVDSALEEAVLPNSVTALGAGAFYCCGCLREVVFNPDSCLETIGAECFFLCAFTRITIPKSVRDIGARAFMNCRDLVFVCFEEGSRLSHVGR